MSAKKKPTTADSAAPAAKKATTGKKAGVKKALAAKKTAAANAPGKKAPTKKTPAKKAPATSKTGTKKKAAAKPAGGKRVQLSPEERYQRIQREAYFLAEKNGFLGDASEYWTRAETLIDRQYA